LEGLRAAWLKTFVVKKRSPSSRVSPQNHAVTTASPTHDREAGRSLSPPPHEEMIHNLEGVRERGPGWRQARWREAWRTLAPEDDEGLTRDTAHWLRTTLGLARLPE